MATTLLTKQDATGAYAYAGVNLNFQAMDTVNDNHVILTDKEILLIWNTDVSPQTVTFTSTDDPLGRTKDITAESIAAGEIFAYGPMKRVGWGNASQELVLIPSDALLECAVLMIPGL